MSADTYAERTVSKDTIYTMAVERVCGDVEAFASFLESSSNDRQASAYFGQISTPELVSKILLNPAATKDQTHAAIGEIRQRYLEDQAAEVAHQMKEIQQ